MFCQQCGAKNNDGAKFCFSCGKEVTEGGQQTGLNNNHAMSTEKLSDTLEILYDMEKSNYLLTNNIVSLENEINNLALPRNIPIGQLYDDRKTIFEEKGLGVAVMLVMLGGFIGLVKGLFTPNIGTLLRSILVNGFYFGIIPIVLLCIIVIIKNRIAKRKNKTIKKQHGALMLADAARVQQEKRQQIVLNYQKQEVEQKLKESTKLLNEMYEMSGIAPEYRKLLPIGYMYDFVRLGICNKFEGSDGLYYLIRKEMRAEQLQCTLNEMVTKLDQVVDHQKQIYYELRSINHTSSKMVSEVRGLSSEVARNTQITAQNAALLREISRNTSITAYNTERSAREAECYRWMHNNYY